MQKFDEKGFEIPDQTPVEMPVSAKRPESMSDMIARLVRARVSEVAADREMPTFEEEDDFSDPTEALDEQMASDYYVNETAMQAIGPENDLEGSQGVLTETGSGSGSSGDNSTSGAQEVFKEDPGAEAPQE